MVDTNYISWHTAQGLVAGPTLDTSILDRNQTGAGQGLGIPMGLGNLFGKSKAQRPGMAGPKVNTPAGHLPPARNDAPKALPSGKENPMASGKKPPALPPGGKPKWNDPTGAIEVKTAKVLEVKTISNSPTAARAGKQAELLLDHTEATRPMTGKATGTGRIGAAGKEVLAKLGDWCRKCPGMDKLTQQATRVGGLAKGAGKLAAPVAVGVGLHEAGTSFNKGQAALKAEAGSLRDEHTMVKLSEGASQGIKQYQNLVAEKIQPGIDQFVMGETVLEKAKGLGKAGMGLGESVLQGVPTIIGGAAGGIHAAFDRDRNNSGRLEARGRGPRLPVSGKVDASPQLLADTDAVNLDASRSGATMTPTLAMPRTRQAHHR